MESDSDSDASHISATPPRPRDQKPPSPPRPPPLPLNLLSSYKYKAKVKPGKRRRTSPSKPKTKPPPEPSKENPPPAPELPPYPPPLPSSLPFRICTSSSSSFQIRRVHPATSHHSIENLPAGSLAKSSSFSKIQRASLNFEPIDPNPAASQTGDGFPPADKSNVSKNNLHRPSNLVGAQAPLPPMKPRKRNGGGEGNFVKLNMNRNARKFVKWKGKRKSSYASPSGRTSYRRRGSKRKVQGEGEAEAGIDGVGDEDKDGLVSEITRPADGSDEMVESAILAARNDASDENLARLLKAMYGYDSFREGQLEAIRMVLDRKSTMLVLPTGAGKSLCYQIPAVIFPGITLVVSPLVSLMIDQLRQLPPMIQGGLLSSSQTPREAAETLSMIQEGNIKVLYVSPERLLNAEFLSIFSSSIPISLLVVDEAHCVSEWSHNFRPSFMRLRASLLRASLNIGCILAMTATATATTLKSVMSALEINSTNLIQKAQLRDNLQLSVSMSGNRMKDLLKLIKSSPFSEVQSIIIYCKFQFETDIITGYLCDNNIPAKSYHSAMPARDRARAQEMFCSNKIRVVVATVAFGMGLDKRDVGAVIHHSLPESLEEYVQEIGRAGRDGRRSYCHLFVDDVTYFKLRCLTHSDGIDEYAVSKFLSHVFSNDLKSSGRVCCIIKEAASRNFDMKEEVMLTLLTQLELGEVHYLRLLPQLNVTCELSFYKTSPLLLADKDIMISAIVRTSEIKQGQYVFNIPTVANSIRVTTNDLLNHLQNLKLKGELTYEVKDPAFCYKVVQVPEDFCSLSAHMTKWLSDVESCKVRKLDAMYNAAIFAVNECKKEQGCHGDQHTTCLQRNILDYFREVGSSDIPNKMGQNSQFLRADIKVFLQSNSHAKFTPRAIARILHGIPSPAYPSSTWSNTHFWGRYTQTNFQVVMDTAKLELMNFIGKDAS